MKSGPHSTTDRPEGRVLQGTFQARSSSFCGQVVVGCALAKSTFQDHPKVVARRGFAGAVPTDCLALDDFRSPSNDQPREVAA